MTTTLQAKSGPNRYGMLCVVLSFMGWVPLIISRPMIHGGTFFDTMLTWTGVVIGGYATIELIRYVKSPWAKVLWGIWLVPYAFVVAVALYLAVPYVPRLFAI